VSLAGLAGTVSLWQLPWLAAQAAGTVLGALALGLTTIWRAVEVHPRELRRLLLLVLIGYAARVAMAWLGDQQLEGDSYDYYRFSAGKPFLQVVSWPYKTPGYSLFIWMMSQASVLCSPRLICLVQCLLSAYSIVQMYLLVRAVRDRRSAWLAAALATGTIPWIEWAAVVVESETFAIALSLAIARRLVAWLGLRDPVVAAAAARPLGLWIGAATYVHALFVGWLALVPIAMCLSRAPRRTRLWAGLQCVVWGLVPLLPLLMWRYWTTLSFEIRVHWQECYAAARYPYLRIRQPAHYTFVPATTRFPDDPGRGIGTRLCQTLVTFYEPPPGYWDHPVPADELERRRGEVREQVERRRAAIRPWIAPTLGRWYGAHAVSMLDDQLHRAAAWQRYREQLASGAILHTTANKLLDLWTMPPFGALGYAYYRERLPRFFLSPWWIVVQHQAVGLLAVVGVLATLWRGDRWRAPVALFWLLAATSLFLVLVHVPESRYTFCVVPIEICAAAEGLRALLLGVARPTRKSRKCPEDFRD
jgi:hypothetical protein